jgi:hypothetical protein
MTLEETHDDGFLDDRQGAYTETKNEKPECHQVEVFCDFAYKQEYLA